MEDRLATKKQRPKIQQMVIKLRRPLQNYKGDSGQCLHVANFAR
jgi:hypothetical protein